MRMLRIVALALLVAVVGLAPSMAHADSYTRRDGTGDLQRMDDSDEDTEEWTPLPDRAEGDIVWTRVRHAKKQVRVRIKFVALDRVDGGGEAGLTIRTSKKKTFIYSLNASYGDWVGHSDFFRYQRGCDCRVVATPRPAAAGTCKGRTHTMDYADNSILMVLPRKCIGNPKWIRLNISVSRGWESSTNADDDAYTSRTNPTGWAVPVFSPRIYR